MSEFNYTPRGSWLVIEERAPDRKHGDILLPENIRLPVVSGGVVAVGPGPVLEDGVTRVPLPVEVGERVTYRSYYSVPLEGFGRPLQMLLGFDLDTRLGGDLPEPLNDRILVRGDQKHAEQQLGGILVQTNQREDQEAEVLAVGPGMAGVDGKPVPLPIEPGDTVRYLSYTGAPFRYRDGLYQVIRLRDVLGVLRGFKDSRLVEGTVTFEEFDRETASAEAAEDAADVAAAEKALAEDDVLSWAEVREQLPKASSQVAQPPIG